MVVDMVGRVVECKVDVPNLQVQMVVVPCVSSFSYISSFYDISFQIHDIFLVSLFHI